MSTTEQLNSALADRYVIERLIGEGGMATVYLARDLKHNRKVALKVLKPDLGAVVGVERFLSEIQVTANLQHPNLLPLFDSGETQGLLFYVMPFVEGESLRHRLAREKQLPIDEAIRIAAAVLNALDYAHGHGVVHRDLKPENILLQHGQPVVADFGIALAVSNAGGDRITQTGLSLGTPQYMSPEQATGDREIDGRADIYSLAAVLYEMLAGEPPHIGNTAQAIIAKLMTEDVRSLAVLRRSVPTYVDVAICRALEKLPADRFLTAAQFAEALVTSRAATVPEIAGAATGASAVGAVAGSGGLRRVRLAIPWLAAAIGVAFGVWTLIERPDAAATPVPVHFSFTPKVPILLNPTLSQIALTPDGSRILFTAATIGPNQIWIRSLADEEIHPVAGTERATSPFLSPDGAWIGFRADGELRRMPIGGGASIAIAKSSVGVPAWSSKNVILFTPRLLSPLFAVPASGGVPKQITALDSTLGEIAHGQPAFLPDGDAFVFTIASARGSGAAPRRIALGTMNGHVTQLDLIGVDPRFVAPDHLVYVRPDGVVEAVRFDPKTRRVTGSPVAVLEQVAVTPPGAAGLAVSSNGSVLVYLHGLPLERLALLSSTGEVQVLPGEPRAFRHVRVSPDGSRIAADVAASDGTRDVWAYDLTSGALSKLTFDGLSSDPVWSPDGKRIAFSRLDSAGNPHAYSLASDGSENQPRLLVGGPGSQWASVWEPDGKTFVFDERPPQHSTMDVGAIGDDGKRHVLVEGPAANVRLPAISPDGHWLAYTSDESKRVEVYVRSMNGPGRWLVSVQGGTQPVWSRDGKTLYYRDDAHIVAATVASGSTFVITARRNFADDHFALENTINYDAMPDGKHLVVLVPVTEGAEISVVVNWMEELKKRLGQ